MVKIKGREAERSLEDFAPGHFRTVQGLEISSVAWGMRPGASKDSALEAAERGCRLFDAGPPSLHSESAAVLAGVRGGASVLGARSGSLEGSDELETSLEDALRSLGVERLDVYYLEELEEVDGERLRRSFEALEQARRRDRIRFYGVSSSSGLLGEPDDPGYLPLAELVKTAREVGGDAHGLRFVQAPYSITRPIAMTARNQIADGSSRSLVQASERLGLSFIAAAPLDSGRTLVEDHPWLSGALPSLDTLAQRAIQFVRSTPGIASALVGMARPEHAVENLALARVPPISRERFLELVPPEAPQVPWLYD